jgi:hypothetical protein
MRLIPLIASVLLFSPPENKELRLLNERTQEIKNQSSQTYDVPIVTSDRGGFFLERTFDPSRTGVQHFDGVFLPSKGFLALQFNYSDDYTLSNNKGTLSVHYDSPNNRETQHYTPTLNLKTRLPGLTPNPDSVTTIRIYRIQPGTPDRIETAIPLKGKRHTFTNSFRMGFK